MEMKELIKLSEYTTFRMGSLARYFVVVHNVAELEEGFQFAKSKNLPVFILGSGSNIVLGIENIFEAVVLKIEIKGFEVVDSNNSVNSADEKQKNTVMLKIGAGEIWDDVVKRSVEKGLAGIEALSWIPGTVGATPIQNVGAYGKEIGDVLVSLQAYEIATGIKRMFTNEECQFKYRDSIFKHKLKDQFVITSVTIRLHKRLETVPVQIPDYPGVRNYLADNQIINPDLHQIRQAIIEIRNVKLPDPKAIASVGSFFKNPIVSEQQYEQLKEKHPAIIAFPLADGNYKLSAGWLLENLGFKGKQFGNLEFYMNNALVLVNKSNATFEELKRVVEIAQNEVLEKFDVTLEVEPTLVIS